MLVSSLGSGAIVDAGTASVQAHGVARTILHVDMDAFFVSVELRRRPELVGLPVVVGGTGDRGVVAAASYEARRFGVHSALSSAIARRRCPEAVFLAGDYDSYQQVSAQVHEIFERYTPLVEPLALDEAFLDVTGATGLFGSGRQIANRLRDEISAQVGLRCSVGVAVNKFIAKVASVAAKPVALPDRIEPGRGVVVIEPGSEAAFLGPLSVERIWGVGPVTLGHLHDLGIRTIDELAGVDPKRLHRRLGRTSAEHLVRLAAGIDERAVEPNRAARSIGHEQTFADDLLTRAQVTSEVVRLVDAVAERLRAAGRPARTITLKVRYSDFSTITRSFTSPQPLDTAPSILAGLEPLLRALDLRGGVRLLGVSASNLGHVAVQLSLIDAHDDDERKAADTIDMIRSRFGRDAIGPASSIGPGDGGGPARLRTVRRGAQQWGPDVPTRPRQ